MRAMKKYDVGNSITDETLDAKYAGKILFPDKIAKAKELLGNSVRFTKAKPSQQDGK